MLSYLCNFQHEEIDQWPRFKIVSKNKGRSKHIASDYNMLSSMLRTTLQYIVKVKSYGYDTFSLDYGPITMKCTITLGCYRTYN